MSCLVDLNDSDGRKRLIESAGFVVNFIKKEWPHKADMKNRHGGVLAVGMLDGEVRLTSKVRQVRQEKLLKYNLLAPEKVRRLSKHSEHNLSSQSRNPKENAWGGAVRGDKYLWGFSGLTEALDEILTIGLAHCKDDLTKQEAEQLLNTHYPDLDKNFVRAFFGMAETDFEYGHIL